MAPKELTKHQISSRLAYTEQVPAFLQKLQNRMAGGQDDEEEDEFDEFGRERRRASPPQRPGPGSGDEGKGDLDEEDAEDERPQIVVLKEGRHLSAKEVERERKGITAEEDEEGSTDLAGPSTGGREEKAKTAAQSGLSFGSKKPAAKVSAAKRKAASISQDDGPSDPSETKGKKKKPKKAVKEKKLLSFGDDA